MKSRSFCLKNSWTHLLFRPRNSVVEILEEFILKNSALIFTTRASLVIIHFYKSKAVPVFVGFSKHILNQLKMHKLTWATPFGPIQDPIAFSSLLTIDNWWTPNKADLSSANKGKMSKYWSDASDGLHRKSRPETKKKD